MPIALCPAQQQAFDALERALEIEACLFLVADEGCGKTTILRQLHERHGGGWVDVKQLLRLTAGRHPLALEETFFDWLSQALDQHDRVFVDDLSMLNSVTGGCGAYPRAGLLSLGLKALAEQAWAKGKRLIIGAEHVPGEMRDVSFLAHQSDFTLADFEALCRAHLAPGQAEQLHFARIHRFAPSLNAHQLVSSCRWLRGDAEVSTERFLVLLQQRAMISNVDLEEVQQVSLKDLCGVDEVVDSLEKQIVLPLENDQLAAELGLRAKRGVLLVGPPGTGKTTVGRALAHRLQSKFFLMDGTIIHGSDYFYHHVRHLFAQARENAPSVLFIDDGDLLFESISDRGFYRYLLTMLDGLESRSNARVCVMMTAMKVSSLPPALLRSGRIELWLEMKLPDETARLSILEQNLRPRPERLEDLNLSRLISVTEGFTGADLKRLIEDGKNLFASDLAAVRPLRPTTDYFLDAAAGVRSNKELYAGAEADAET